MTHLHDEDEGDADYAAAAGFARRHPVLMTFVIPTLVGIAAVVGVRVYGPARDIDAVRAELQTYKQENNLALARLQVRDSIEWTRLAKIDEVLAIWLRGECMDRSTRDRLLMGLSCGSPP